MSLKNLSILQLILILFSLENTAIASIDVTNDDDQPEELEFNNTASQINCFSKSFYKNVPNIKHILTARAACSIERNHDACNKKLLQVATGFTRAYPCSESSCEGHENINLGSHQSLYLCTKKSDCMNTQIFKFKESHEILLPKTPKTPKTTGYYYLFSDKTTSINGVTSPISKDVLVCFQE